MLNSRGETRDKYGAFTLIECCVALFVLSVCCLFLTPIVKMSVKLDATIKQDTQYEWHLFLIQLETLLSDSELIGVSGDKLILKEYGESAVYYVEKYNTMIRRKKGGTGHEPLLIDIQKVSFSEEREGVKIEVDFLQGESREAHVPIKRNEEDKSKAIPAE